MQLEPQPGLFVWTLVTFTGLLFLLFRYAFGPLQKLLDEREKNIKDVLDSAEKARSEAQSILAENEEKMRNAREETRSIINEGHRIVSTMKKEADERAKRESEEIVRQARVEIDREVQKSLEGLKATVANLSIRISRQILNDNIDESKHAELAEKFIDKLKKSHVRKN